MDLRQSIQEKYQQHLSENVGYSYAILHNNQIIDCQYKGMSNISEQIPVSSQSVFRIASMTKSFTAMAILQLEYKGLLSLNDLAETHVPQLRNFQYLNAATAKITVQDLLCHMAGLPEDNLWGDRLLDWKMEDFLDFLQKGVSFSNNPGVQYEYSNLAYGILGQIIVNISRYPYQEYIQTHIFQPLQMQNTYWEVADIPKQNTVLGYRKIKEQWQEEPILHDGAFGAMGGIWTTMEDFIKYTKFHLNAYQERTDLEINILPTAALQSMHRAWSIDTVETNVPLANNSVGAFVHGYGYGLFYRKDSNGNVYFGHNGSLPGYNSNWWCLPEKQLAIIAFSNTKFPKLGQFNFELLQDIIASKELDFATKKPSAILQQRKEELLSFFPHWEDATRASHVFVKHFFDDFMLDELQAETASYFQQLGDNYQITDLLPENALRGSFEIKNDALSLKIKLTLSP